MSTTSDLPPSLETIPLCAQPPLSLDLFIEQSGLSSVTCWRYREKGWLKTVLIGGRHYVTREAIAEFNARAARGDFAGTRSKPKSRGGRKGA